MPAAPTQRDNWQSCYYEIGGTISASGQTIKLKESQVTSFLIERDYDRDHLPVILIGLSLEDDITITSDSTIQLEINKVMGTNEDGVIRPQSKSSYINSIFSFVVLTDTPSSSYYKNIIQSKQEKPNTAEYYIEDAESSTEYILVKKENMTASKHIMNCVLKEATMTETVAMLLTQANCSNVLMSNLDNTESYKELIIPPLPLLECINYLKNYYGFHKEDTVIFMDIDVTYIVRKDGLCTAYRNGEQTSIDICLNPSESAYDQCRGIIYSGNKVYVNVGSDHFERSVGGTITNETEGTNVLIYNEATTKSSTVATENQAALAGNNTSVKSTMGHNKFVQSQIECRKLENQFVFTIGCLNADISIFTPNKEFSVISNCAEIAMDVVGKYRLTKHVTTFSKSGHYFIPISDITLKKTRRD